MELKTKSGETSSAAWVCLSLLLIEVLLITRSGQTLERSGRIASAMVLSAWVLLPGLQERSEHKDRSPRTGLPGLVRLCCFAYGALLVFMTLQNSKESAHASMLTVLLLCCALTPLFLWRKPIVLAAYLGGQQVAYIGLLLLDVPLALTDVWPVVAIQVAVAIAAVLDLTRLQQAHEALNEQHATLRASTAASEKKSVAYDHALSEFLATVCHDLSQPVSALALCVDELINAMPGDDHAVALNRVRSASANLSTAIDVLTEIAMIDSGRRDLRREPINLVKMAEGICSTFRTAADAKGLRLHIGSLEGHALGDPAVLHTILANLVSNAIKYTDRGFVHISTQAQGTQIQLIVQDSGRGIAPDDQPRLFEAFFRGSNVSPGEPGMGLGLALVQRLVRRADLDIVLTSTSGAGSRFMLTMPIALGPRTPCLPLRKNAYDAKTLHGCCVWIVDDDVFVRASLRRTLERWGAIVRETHNIEQVTTSLDAGEGRPDLVIVDYRLGQFASGFDVVASLKGDARTASAPILMTTGDLDPEVRARADAQGVHLMYKPLSPCVLYEALATLLAQRVRSAPAYPLEPLDR